MREFDKKLFPHDCNGDQVTDLMVLKSNAYYIGRLYWDFDIGVALPYSRESGYYTTKEEAQAELDSSNFEVRDCVENNWAYHNGNLPLHK